MDKIISVPVTLKTDDACSREVAESIMMRANPHDSELVEKKLSDEGISVETLMQYFQQVAAVVAEFHASQKDLNLKLTLKPHEIRSLYLPNIMAVIFASVGNCKIGNYEFVITPSAITVDRSFVIEFSAKLESLRQYIKGDIGQIGNRSAQALDNVMAYAIFEPSVDGRNVDVYAKDGVKFESRGAGLAALAGVSLVEEGYRILYTGLDEVNFRETTDGIIDHGIVEAKTE